MRPWANNRRFFRKLQFSIRMTLQAFSIPEYSISSDGGGVFCIAVLIWPYSEENDPLFHRIWKTSLEKGLSPSVQHEILSVRAGT